MFYRAPGEAVCADVIPFYEDGTFKLFYLRDFRNIPKHGEGCPWCLLTTKDLVTYEDHGPVLLRGGADAQDLYVFTGCCIKAGDEYMIFYTGHNPHLRAQGLPEQKILRAKSRDLIHWEKDTSFVFEAPAWLEMHDFRDPFVFFDEESGQYCMLIAGRVKNENPVNCKGVTLIARSADLAHWEVEKEPFYAPHAYFTHECPDLFRMGDWWYLVFREFTDKLVTTYRMSRSPFGPWKAPKGNNFDGHAFYAAKSVSDGKRRILFGWNCIKLGERDNAPWQWGGTIIPHEIVQQADGSLGGRLDPGLSALLNYGNVYSLGADNFAVESGAASASEGTLSMSGSENYVRLGDFHRSYVTFRADMGASDCVGYVMRQDGREYRVVIERENGQLYMKVLSPDDPSHKVNSVIALPDDTDVFDVKIVNDGEFVEFFVNDTCALTAHTAMTGTTHTAYLYSDSAATFSDVNIAKLRPYGEI